MVEKPSAGERAFDLINGLLVALITLACLYPILHVFAASLSDPVRLMRHMGPMVWPQGFTLEGFKVVFKNPNIYSGYRNTVFYVVVGTGISMVLTTLGAYALSRKGYPFRRFLMVAIVFTMYFGGGLIPNFLLVRTLGMYNTAWALLLPTAIGTWNLVVMRTSFATVPESLAESAYIDGANDFVILWRIFLPLSKATLAVIALFYGVGRWNSWFEAMIYLRRREMFPLQLILREILISNSASGNSSMDVEIFYLDEVIRYATIVVATLPILLVYPFLQKYFMKGVMLGSVKG